MANLICKTAVSCAYRKNVHGTRVCSRFSKVGDCVHAGEMKELTDKISAIEVM